MAINISNPSTDLPARSVTMHTCSPAHNCSQPRPHLGCVGSMATALTQPPPRLAHFSTSIGEQLYIWGGRTKDFKKGEVTSTVHQFNQKSETWTINSCNGPSPPCSYKGASASAGHHIYMCDGYDGSRRLNSLHKLDTQSWTWSELTKSGPMRKTGCRMIAFGRKLLLFGGHGIPSGPTQPGAMFIKSTDGRGLTELHLFDLKEGEGVLHCAMTILLSNYQCWYSVVDPLCMQWKCIT